MKAKSLLAALTPVLLTFFVTSTSFAGGDSSGGGFTQETGVRILKIVAPGLAKKIRSVSPGTFTNLKIITPEEMASIIEHVRISPQKNVQQVDEGVSKQKMLTFGTDKTGRYIEALQPFFTAYSSSDFFETDSTRVLDLIQNVETKLLQEVLHHAGILDNTLAFDAARRLINSMSSNLTVCEIPTATIKNYDDLGVQAYRCNKGGAMGASDKLYIAVRNADGIVMEWACADQSSLIEELENNSAKGFVGIAELLKDRSPYDELLSRPNRGLTWDSILPNLASDSVAAWKNSLFGPAQASGTETLTVKRTNAGFEGIYEYTDVTLKISGSAPALCKQYVFPVKL